MTNSHLNNTFRGMSADQLSRIISKYAGEFDAASFVDNIRYQGFDRENFISDALSRITPAQMIKLALLGSIRGANFDKIVKSSGAMDSDLLRLVSDGVVVRRAKEPTDITILRCSAAIPGWVAYFMGTAGVTKKFPSLSCPAVLQFPAAAALPMSATVRAQHVEFAMHFSRTIGGNFNENIYMTMVNNMLPLSDIPDSVKLVLGASSDGEAMQVDVQSIITGAVRMR